MRRISCLEATESAHLEFPRPGSGLLVALALSALVNLGLSAQGSPCLTNADTAAAHISQVTMALTGGDSARLVGQGLPYRPRNVSLVTDSATCTLVVKALNSTSSDSATMIKRAYVFKVGKRNFAAVGENTRVYVFFDDGLHWLVGLAPLD